MLEVKVLSIDLPIDYGYNGCSGFMPDNCDKTQRQTILPLDRADDDLGVPAGHRHSA